MIHLLPLDEAKLEGLLRDLEGGLRQLCSNGPEVGDFLLPVLQQALDFHRRVVSQPPWHGYLGVESEANRLVGICGFKGNPSATGDVEIAYGTVPGFEGRGYATGMATALVEIAFRSTEVRRVIAHTLPEKNASSRVLQKVGMVNVGEVMDPEDGKVWRWEIRRPEVDSHKPALQFSRRPTM
jgi:RimJ/RimL family protein N-acetyltransferase